MAKNAHTWPAYIDNLIDLLMILSSNPKAVGEGFLCHDGEMVTFQQLCADLAEGLGVKPPKLIYPIF